MAVVDEDRGQARVCVLGGGDPTDVPAVARGNERQQANRGVLCRMQGAGCLPRGDPHRCQCQRIDGVGHRAGHQALLRQLKRYVLAHGAIRKLDLVAGDLVGDLHLQARHPQPRRVVDQLVGLAKDPDMRRGLGLGGVVRGLRHCQGHAWLRVLTQLQVLDDIALPAVQVHRAGMHLAYRAGGVDGAQQPSIGGVNDHDLLAGSAAQRYRRVGGLRGERGRAGGQRSGEPALRAAAQEALLGQVRHDGFGAEGGDVRLRERLFHRRAVDVPAQDVGVGRVKHAGLHRPAQQRVRVVDQVGIHRLIARYEHDQ